jgi:hypothetical protein
MPDRRDILKGGLLLSALAAAPARGATSFLLGNTLVLIGTDCINAAAFARGFGAAAQRGACDVAIETLSAFPGTINARRVIGLARQSETLPLQQLLTDSGFRPALIGQHHRTGDLIHHEVTAPLDSTKALETALNRAGAVWPEVMGLYLQTASGNPSAKLSLSVASQPAPEAHAFLSTFAFERCAA